MYLGRQYDRYIEETKQNLYGSKQMHLPVPKLVTLYNGEKDVEDKVLRLSDSFITNAEQSDVQVNVRLININMNKNRELLESCKPLEEYSWFVEKVRENKKGLTLEAAVDKVIDEMPEGFQIKRFIMSNRAEVKNMCLTEYNEAETMQRFKEEGREEGRELVNRLNNWLVEQGRNDEMIRSFSDMELQKQLLSEMEAEKIKQASV